MNCPDHGKVRPILGSIAHLHNNCKGFKVPRCPICGKECTCPPGRLQCPHGGSDGGGPPSYEYCLRCEEI